MGVALIQNLYGDAGMTPLMIIGSVPLYNIFAVIVLAVFRPEQQDHLEQPERPLSSAQFAPQGSKTRPEQPGSHAPLGSFAPQDSGTSPERKPAADAAPNRKQLADTAKSVVTNPILLGVLAGLGWALLQLPLPPIADKTLESVARVATPLGLMAMGATFDIKKALSGIRTAGLGAFMKLIGLGCIFIPVAVILGFRGDKLAAALIMCGSPTTVSCYVMAKNMGHDGTLTSSTVMLTTFFSAFTLTRLAVPAEEPGPAVDARHGRNQPNGTNRTAPPGRRGGLAFCLSLAQKAAVLPNFCRKVWHFVWH